MSRSYDRRSTVPFHSTMTLSNCLGFLSSVHGSVQDLSLLKAACHLADLRGNLALGLLNLVQLGIQVVNGSLGLGEVSSQVR